MKKNYALLLMLTLCIASLANAQITLSQTTSNAIVPGTIACSAGGVTADNIYYRNYDLAALGYSQFDVTQVTFGVENAANIDPAFLVDVIIYSHTGAAFPGGTLTPVATVPVVILPSDTGTLKTVPIVASVVAPATLVVAIDIPDEITPMHTTQFFIGSNAGGQSAPGYISSAGCGITEPTTLTAVGFPNVHIILDVSGIALSVDEFSVSRVSISPNPTSDFVNIELHPSNAIKAIEIYSITGQLVSKLKSNTKVNISNLNSGVYLMKIETTNGSITKKLIKS